MIEIQSRKWKAPSSLLICGASGSGKTFFTANLIANRGKIFDPPPRNVVYFFKIWQEIYDRMKETCPEIRFINTPPSSFEGFRDLMEGYKKDDGVMVIFDDYEEEMVRDSTLYTKIYTVLSHHANLVPVALMHNLFRKELRTLSLNVHRLVLMKSPRDISQISYLSRQCFPTTKNYLSSVYNHVMGYEGFPYIVVNFAPHSGDGGHIKVSTRIFESEYPMEVYKEKSKSGQPYEKLVLINADLYKHLVESNHPVTSVSQTVNNSMSPNASVKTVSKRGSTPPPPPLAMPLASNPSVDESLGDVLRRGEGESSAEVSKKSSPAPDSRPASKKTVKKAAKSSTPIDEVISEEGEGSRKRKNEGTRDLPERKARKPRDYDTWG